MGYRNLEEREMGREALFEQEANRRAEKKAIRLVEDREESVLKEQERISEIEAAEAEGIKIGSDAGKMDATRFFAEQGFIPRQVFGQVENEFNFMDANRETQGLGIPQEMSAEALNEQAINISDKLLEASIQGAPKDKINETLTQLNVPDQVKQQAAKMFVAKRLDAEQNQMTPSGVPEANMLPGSAVDRIQSPITTHAQQLASQTDPLIQRLHERIAQAQQGQQQQQQQA